MYVHASCAGQCRGGGNAGTQICGISGSPNWDIMRAESATGIRGYFHTCKTTVLQNREYSAMPSLSSLRVVYKVVDGQEIDADVFLPRPDHNNSSSAPICTCVQLYKGAQRLRCDLSSDRHPWRSLYAGIKQNGKPRPNTGLFTSRMGCGCPKPSALSSSNSS